MMVALRLAFRNILGAGLRTWLNVFVLSFCYVVIVFYNGMLDGWNQQARKDTIEWEVGQGQYWNPQYDPFDPFSFDSAHSVLPANLPFSTVPILVSQATVYPEGRLYPVSLKGIPHGQQLLKIPTNALDSSVEAIPIIIGRSMAAALNIGVQDRMMLRVRDARGTFDAVQVEVVRVFKTNVPSIDQGTIWMDLEVMQKLLNLPNEASLLVCGEVPNGMGLSNWEWHSQESLLSELNNIINSKKGSGAVMYGLLLIIALIAIFDTQVLSIFRRQKEIGTYIALGMTRQRVLTLFTIEGGAHSLLAVVLGAAYGIPLLAYISHIGIPMGSNADQIGIAIAETVTPVYGLKLILMTIALVVGSATIVSYFPSRKITRLKPTEALKGKIQ